MYKSRCHLSALYTADKRSRHLGSDGVYLDDITELEPEVAALYFPKRYIATLLFFILSVSLLGDCLPVCLSFYLSLSLRLSIYLSVCLYICLSMCLSMYLSICLSACLSFCLLCCLSVCLPVYLFIYLSVCFSVLKVRTAAQGVCVAKARYAA